MKILAAILIAFATISLTIPTQAANSGTGFFVSRYGYFVTNYHVIRGAVKIVARYGGKDYLSTIVATDKENDVALLQIVSLREEDLNFPFLYVDANIIPTPGSDVFTIGFPDPDVLGETPKTTKGSITALAGIKDDPHRMQISVQIQPGNSGGPLVNQAGSVIGITTATINPKDRMEKADYVPQNVNYAVKASYIKAIMDRMDVRQFGGVSALLVKKPFEQLQRETEAAVVRVISSTELPKSIQRPPVTKTPPVSPSPSTPSPGNTPAPSPKTPSRGPVLVFGGNVGKLAATFYLQWLTPNTIEGTYHYPGRTPRIAYDLKGDNSVEDRITMEEYTRGELTARITLNKQTIDGKTAWVGTMNNLDGRVLPMKMTQK